MPPSYAGFPHAVKRDAFEFYSLLLCRNFALYFRSSGPFTLDSWIICSAKFPDSKEAGLSSVRASPQLNMPTFRRVNSGQHPSGIGPFALINY